MIARVSSQHGEESTIVGYAASLKSFILLGFL